MLAENGELRVERHDDGWRLVGAGFDGVEQVNEFLGYLGDRNYAALTVRSYAFDLLHFSRWMAGEGLGLEAVDTDVLLRYLAACRTQVLPNQHGGNVFSICDGRNVGYAPRTVNRRLAALSGLFALREMRDPAAPNPIPRRREAGSRTARGQRAGLLGHLTTPSPRSGLRLREPRRLPRGLRRDEIAELLGSLRTVRDRAIAGLMLFSGLRSAEVRTLAVEDVDIALGWVRVLGKGEKERRVPVDREVCALVQSYLLTERPDSTSRALFLGREGTDARAAADGGRAPNDLSLSPRAGRGAGGQPARAAAHVRHRAGRGRRRLARDAGAAGPRSRRLRLGLRPPRAGARPRCLRCRSRSPTVTAWVRRRTRRR